MEAHKNIQVAKLAIMSEVGYVQKQKSKELKYTFAGESALIQALRPSMITHGVTLQPLNTEIVESISYPTKYTTMHRVRVRSEFRLVHGASDTFETVVTLGEAADAGDKAVPKALTCAYKYALRQSFIIETGDDPDEHASVPVDNSKKEPPTNAAEKGDNRIYRQVSKIPENPWLWKIQGETIHKGKYVAALTDDVLKKLKKSKARDDLHLKGFLTGLDMEALFECFRNEDARTDALSVIMDEENADKNKKEEDQTNE